MNIWPFAKNITYNYHGKEITVYKNVDDIYPILLEDEVGRANLRQSINSMTQIDASLRASISDHVDDLFSQINATNKEFLAPLREAYEVYNKSPYIMHNWYARQTDGTIKKRKQLMELKVKLESGLEDISSDKKKGQAEISLLLKEVKDAFKSISQGANNERSKKTRDPVDMVFDDVKKWVT
jgi:hypothetical protein